MTAVRCRFHLAMSLEEPATEFRGICFHVRAGGYSSSGKDLGMIEHYDLNVAAYRTADAPAFRPGDSATPKDYLNIYSVGFVTVLQSSR